MCQVVKLTKIFNSRLKWNKVRADLLSLFIVALLRFEPYAWPKLPWQCAAIFRRCPPYGKINNTGNRIQLFYFKKVSPFSKSPSLKRL